MERKKLTDTYLSAFCKETAMLYHAGISITQGVDIMQNDEQSKEGKALLLRLHKKMEAGAPFSAALDDAGCFPEYMVKMIQIGEKTGKTEEVLQSLASHYERRERLAVAVKNAALYPSVLLLMMIGVVLILIIQVLPIFNDVFARMGTQLSPLAAQLMRLGIMIRGASVIIIAALGLIFITSFVCWAIPTVRGKIAKSVNYRWGGMWLFGRIASYRFVSSMALALHSGLEIEDSINMAAALNSGSAALKEKYERCTALLKNGSNLSEALRESGILSAGDSRMLMIGEKSGMTDSAMEDIARRSSERIQDEISDMVGKIEPTLVIVTSVIVGIILLSVMLPLMGIMTQIG